MDAKANAFGILKVDLIEKIDRTVYTVAGDSGKEYHIMVDNKWGHMVCTCRGSVFHGHCKHMKRLIEFLS